MLRKDNKFINVEKILIYKLTYFLGVFSSFALLVYFWQEISIFSNFTCINQIRCHCYVDTHVNVPLTDHCSTRNIELLLPYQQTIKIQKNINKSVNKKVKIRAYVLSEKPSKTPILLNNTKYTINFKNIIYCKIYFIVR